MPEALQADLRLVPIGMVVDRFLVPGYQRGFRWGEDQVRVLLDDLHAIGEADYCLQPIVVKKLAEGRYELIDGQQRLTTLYLLFLAMQKNGLKKPGPPFQISYETRPASAEFLADIDPERATQNIDFFHLHRAYRTIEEWLGDDDGEAQSRADNLYRHLRERAKVIWYEVGDDVDSATLFARLNVGRIPLTNAELVKALLLGRAGATNGSRDAQERWRIEVATQWDGIERRLRDEALWAFIANRYGRPYPTRIDYVFEILAGAPLARDPWHTFFYFKERLDTGSTAEDIWREVMACHALLEEWFEDRDLYHWIGYLVATSAFMGGGQIADLRRASESLTKTHLRAQLKSMIKDRLDLGADDIPEIGYASSRGACQRALLLFNVETSRLLKGSLERYPFHAFKAQRWSLEHIHAQHAESLNRKEQWQAWLREHTKALQALQLDSERAEQRDALVAEIKGAVEDVTRETFVPLSVRVTHMFTSAGAPEELHGLENLALLPSDANSALSNSVFEVKRQKILEMDRNGDYIPICTRRVFFKYYTESRDQQLQLWSTKDRAAYLAAILKTLGPYLTAEEAS